VVFTHCPGKVLSTRHNLALLGARWSIRPGTDVKLAGLGAKWFINQAQTSSIGAYTVLTQCAQVELSAEVLSTRHNSALLGAKWLIRPGTDVKLA